MTGMRSRQANCNWRAHLLASLACLHVCSACGGGASPQPPADNPAPSIDETAPVLTSITGAHDGAGLVRRVSLKATASDNAAVANITLALDGIVLHQAEGAEFEFTLDTGLYAAAHHKLLFTAADEAGNRSQTELRVRFIATPGAPDPADPVDPLPSDLGTSGNEAGSPPPPAAPETLPTASDDAVQAGLPALDVSNPPNPSDDVPPSSILFASLAANQKVWDMTRCTVMGLDDVGIWHLEAWFGGKLAGSITNNRGLDTEFDSNLEPDGARTLTIRVVDLGGNIAICKLPLIVENGIDHGGPRYRDGLDYDIYNLSGDVLLAPDVYEDRALAETQLYIDGQLVMTTSDQRPQYLWKTTDYQDGVHQIFFSYTDTSNNTLKLWSYCDVANAPGTYSVTGRLLAPNGIDPVPGISFRIPKRIAAANWLPNKYENWSDLADAGFSVAKSDSSGYVQTDATGTFTIEGVRPGARGLECEFLTLQLNVQGDINLTPAQLTLPASGPAVPSMAVVTGDGEALADWLAKVGYGKVDSLGKLVLGSEKFLLVDGNNTLPSSYLDLPQYINSPLLDSTAVLFIAAGTHYEEQLVAGTGWPQRLKEGPGLLYCGGSSYDYIEQSHPGAFDFGHVTDDNDFPEPWNASEQSPALPAHKARLTFFQGSTDAPPVAISWLSHVGFSSLQFNTDFNLPLPANWVGSPIWTSWNVEHEAYKTILSGDHVFDQFEYPNNRTILMGLSHRCCFNGLPLPPEPSPQWSFQERVLECLLFTAFQ